MNIRLYLDKSLKNLKLLVYIILAYNTVGCISSKEILLNCYDEKKLFTPDKTYKLSFDTIQSYSDFKRFAINVEDTIQQCSMSCGFLYNFEDNSFNPNADTSKNILIPCLNLYSKHCLVDRIIQPELNILIQNGETLRIQSCIDTILFNPIHDKGLIYKYIYEFYIKKYSDTASYSKLYKSWTHIYIADTLNLQRFFQPVFKILVKAYYNAIVSTLMNNYGKRLCEFNNKKTIELVNFLQFRILINDFDSSNFNYKKEFEKEKQKEEIEISVQDK